MPDYHVIDMARIRENLGAHYNKLDEPDYQGICACGERVPQDVSECPFCGVPIVWQGSKIWQLKYGKPAEAIRRLNVYPPADLLGKWLMRTAGLDGFANQSELGDWKRASKGIDQEHFKNAIVWWQKKQKEKGYSDSGRALIGFALRLILKWEREAKKPARIVVW